MDYNGIKQRTLALRYQFFLMIIAGTLLMQTAMAMQPAKIQTFPLNFKGEEILGFSVSQFHISILTNVNVYRIKNYELTLDHPLGKTAEDQVKKVIQSKNYKLITNVSIQNGANADYIGGNVIVLASDNAITIIDITNVDYRSAQENNEEKPYIKTIEKAHNSLITKLYPCRRGRLVGFRGSIEFVTGSSYGNVYGWKYKRSPGFIRSVTEEPLYNGYKAPGRKNHLLGILNRDPVVAEQVKTVDSKEKNISFQLKRVRNSGFSSPLQTNSELTLSMTQKQLEGDKLPIITAFSNNDYPSGDKVFALLLDHTQTNTKRIIHLWYEYGIIDEDNNVQIKSKYLTIEPLLNTKNNISQMHFTNTYLILITDENEIFALPTGRYLIPLRAQKEESVGARFMSFLKKLGSKQPEEKMVPLTFSFTNIKIKDGLHILYSATNRGYDKHDDLYLITNDQENKKQLLKISLGNETIPQPEE
jgi:hypothetical protein